MEEAIIAHDNLTREPAEDYSKYCRDILDFPQKGVIFKDITPLLKNGLVFKKAIDELVGLLNQKQIDVVAGIEARGLIVGAAIAYRLGCNFIPVRKRGKLPWHVYRKTFNSSYGHGQLEIHQDSIELDQNVLIVDDILATGGTLQAASELIRRMNGNIIGAAFFIECLKLRGRDKIDSIPVFSLIKI